MAQKDPIGNKIDEALSKCLDEESNQTTAGMIRCTIDAREKWDIELNKYYKLLIAELSEEQRELLRVSQRAWIKYRDAEYKFSFDMHNSMQGTVWRIIATDRSLKIVQTRALELKEYYETLDSH